MLDALGIRGEVVMINVAVPQNLLARACVLYDDEKLPFATLAAREGWRSGFVSGADWMRLVLAHIRGTKIPAVNGTFQWLGIVKYGLCSLAALAYLVFVMSQGWYLLTVGAVLIFYLVESQMVFLFPLALDGCSYPFRESRRYTALAGGTLRVTATVIPLALVMLFGGFAGRGFIRCWALGCLAVVLWYEDLRQDHA